MSAPAHPLLTAGLTESLRALLRQHLAAAPDGPVALAGLAGQVIALQLEPFGKMLYLCPTNEDIQLLTEISGTPDVTLAGNLAAFIRAGLATDSAASLRASGLRITGDAETARRLQTLSQALNIDWQRFLSRYLGSGLTHSLLSVLQSGDAWARETLHSLHADAGEYLREEVRWLPDGAETDRFHAEVDRLRADSDRLTARIEQLQARLGTSPDSAR